MSKWISWQKLHDPPYSKEDFELLDLIPKGLIHSMPSPKSP